MVSFWFGTTTNKCLYHRVGDDGFGSYPPSSLVFTTACIVRWLSKELVYELRPTEKIWRG